MKKILCMLVNVLLVINVCIVPVSAQNDAVVEIDVSLYDVNVTVTTDKNGTMTAQLTNEGDTAFYGRRSNSTPTSYDGEYIYSFHFRLPDGTKNSEATTGIYKLRLGNIIPAKEVKFNFVTPDDRITFYNELNDKTSENMYLFLTVERKSFVTVDLTSYSALAGNILNLVNAELVDFGTTYQDIAEDDTETLATVETNFKSVFSSAMTIAKMATVLEDEWVDFAEDLLNETTFDGTYYVDTQDSEALLEVSDAYPYYKTEIEGISVLASSEYVKAFDKATLHLIEESADYGTLKTAFLYFENKGVITPDMTNINALVTAGKDTDLWKNVIVDENTNCDALVANVVAEAQSLMDSGILNNNTNIGGGGGGGASGSSSVDRQSNPSTIGPVSGEDTATIVPPAQTGAFSDVSSSHWANEAIEALADKGILSGKGDGKFVPEVSVTREEFVKIIVAAFELLDDKAGCDFADVKKDSWSYPYIASAAKLGIVSGDGENFNPTSGISRQDMAVIIFRVFEHLGLEVSGESISFDDNSDIADYAKDAVDSLAAAGIINGMGDGTFAPRGTVTRAQAAKVVYGLLALVGGGK